MQLRVWMGNLTGVASRLRVLIPLCLAIRIRTLRAESKTRTTNEWLAHGIIHVQSACLAAEFLPALETGKLLTAARKTNGHSVISSTNCRKDNSN